VDIEMAWIKIISFILIYPFMIISYFLGKYMTAKITGKGMLYEKSDFEKKLIKDKCS